ncbi:indole-3-glycerol phosphate synthase [Clostridium collagenovorans DSM 3089]|uniref:Indole-3-glycerol phosphate synthase n=1 Tax=Clostridium collagenovorans DSM 3089 TaxID=1121306 RepID=A0A1M5UUN5_9CLOT|nr:indole-3-glycerol phosphate synthase TrpC [Clostridium collagenovorans]SHH66727.1 indole-3-glycerol phosphate synthase [Clostridium collagenovorans DSM 3089]
MILDEIIRKKKISIEARKRETSLESMYGKALELLKEDSKLKNLSFKEALSGKNLSVIGEFKKASPSKGIIVEDFNLKKVASYYEELQVDACSVLTEEDFFLGSNENLLEVKKLINKPILRKDFIVDFYQIYESKVLGANAILLICSVLKDDLEKFYCEAKKFNLDVLVEVHNEEELELALKCDCEIIGINNRNLHSFETSFDATKNLLNKIPQNKIVISESGMKSVEDLEIIKGLGVNGVLIGEMFMRNIDNESFIRRFKEFKVTS